MAVEGKIQANGGIGFGGLLTVLFIGLKLGKVINWPWLWVLSPLWIPLAFVLSVVGFILIVKLIALFAKR